MIQPEVQAAMARVNRRDFLLEEERGAEAADAPVEIGGGQTTSQPSLIGVMVSLLQLRRTSRVLEIGTGCGYQTAILAELCDNVLSIEIVPELAARARTTLQHLGYGHIALRCGDGYGGWPGATFDGIVMAAGCARIPQPLIEQLKPGGRLVAPVGLDNRMQLELVEKNAGGSLTRTVVFPVRFVPLTGVLAVKDRSEVAGSEPVR